MTFDVPPPVAAKARLAGAERRGRAHDDERAHRPRRRRDLGMGVVERVSTGLVATSIDLQPVGRKMLAAADVIAAAD